MEYLKGLVLGKSLAVVNAIDSFKSLAVYSVGGGVKLVRGCKSVAILNRN